MVRENHKNIKRHRRNTRHKKRPGRLIGAVRGVFLSPFSGTGAEKSASEEGKSAPREEKRLRGGKKSEKTEGEGRSKPKTSRKSSPLGRKSTPGAEKNQKKRRRGWKQAKNQPKKSAPREEKWSRAEKRRERWRGKLESGVASGRLRTALSSAMSGRGSGQRRR